MHGTSIIAKDKHLHDLVTLNCCNRSRAGKRKECHLCKGDANRMTTCKLN
jgi:hypothetical protein